MSDRHRTTVVRYACDGERFAPGAFDHCLGESITVTIGAIVTTGTLVRAEVEPSGWLVVLTIDTPEPIIYGK